MYMTYLRRELAGRKKQTIIVAAGLAIAIALVMIVNSLAAGVSAAQAKALESVYGVGTDLTVTGAQAEPGGGGGARFDFGEDGGSTTDDGTTELSQSRLMTDFMRGTLDAATVDTVAGVEGVSAASGALSLTNSTFSGELPQRPDDSTDSDTAQGQPPQQGEGGGGGSFGGGSFDVDSFTVLGIDPSADAVGPLSAVEVSDGRGLETNDAGAYVAVSAARTSRSSESSHRPRTRPTRPPTCTSRWTSRRSSLAPATSCPRCTCKPSLPTPSPRCRRRCRKSCPMPR
jgi:hypothetical protein